MTMTFSFPLQATESRQSQPMKCIFFKSQMSQVIKRIWSKPQEPRLYKDDSVSQIFVMPFLLPYLDLEKNFNRYSL